MLALNVSIPCEGRGLLLSWRLRTWSLLRKSCNLKSLWQSRACNMGDGG